MHRPAVGSDASSVHELGVPRGAAAALAAALRLQARAGLGGLGVSDWGVATVARVGGLWFLGAFGRWLPLPVPWLVGAPARHWCTCVQGSTLTEISKCPFPAPGKTTIFSP